MKDIQNKSRSGSCPLAVRHFNDIMRQQWNVSMWNYKMVRLVLDFIIIILIKTAASSEPSI